MLASLRIIFTLGAKALDIRRGERTDEPFLADRIGVDKDAGSVHPASANGRLMRPEILFIDVTVTPIQAEHEQRFFAQC